MANLGESGLFARAREAYTPIPIPPPRSAPEFPIFAHPPARHDAEPAAPAGSTLSRLKQVISQPGQGSLPQPVSGSDPLRGAAGQAPPSVPAAAVTVPLGEVMRLVAMGAPPAASPLDTFRSALRTTSLF
jgi:hypothetical protein